MIALTAKPGQFIITAVILVKPGMKKGLPAGVEAAHFRILKIQGL
jgi:hypothetical protein